MEKSDRITLFTIIKRSVQTFFIFTSGITSLASMEFKLAKRSIISMITLIIFCAVIFLALWFCIIALLICFLIQLHLTILSAIACAILFNLVLLLIILFSLSRLKKNLSFSATRKQLRAVTKFTKETP